MTTSTVSAPVTVTAGRRAVGPADDRGGFHVPASKWASVSIPSGAAKSTSNGRSRMLIASEAATGPEMAPTGDQALHIPLTARVN